MASIKASERDVRRWTNAVTRKAKGQPKAKSPPKPLRRSAAEILFEEQLKSAGIGYVAEYRFHRVRRWRFDFCIEYPAYRLAVEIDGGLFVNGGHNRGAKIIDEHDKHNAALLDGWRVLRVDPSKVRSGEALALVGRALGLLDFGVTK